MGKRKDLIKEALHDNKRSILPDLKEIREEDPKIQLNVRVKRSTKMKILKYMIEHPEIKHYNEVIEIAIDKLVGEEKN